MKKRNKQIDLLKKFNELSDDEETKKEEKPQSAKDKKIQQDQQLFDKLLGSESSTLNHMNQYSEGEYLTKEQEEDELLAMMKDDAVNRLFEGDEIDSKAFEDLVSIQSEKTLSDMDVKRMLPWVKDADSDDYVLIFCDPRPKNGQFRSIITSCYASYPKPMMSKVYFINADSPSENRRFVKKEKKLTIPTSNILSDEKRLWMRSVTALGDKRWSITMFILAKGQIQTLVRDFDYEMLQTIVNNALKRYRDTL